MAFVLYMAFPIYKKGENRWLIIGRWVIFLILSYAGLMVLLLTIASIYARLPLAAF